jgi:hypothetical protein
MSTPEIPTDTGGAPAPAPQQTSTETYLVECEVVSTDECRRQLVGCMQSHLHCAEVFFRRKDGSVNTIQAKDVHRTDLADHRAGYAMIAGDHEDLGIFQEMAREQRAAVLGRLSEERRRDLAVPAMVDRAGEIPTKDLTTMQIRDLAFAMGLDLGLTAALNRLYPAFTARPGAPAPAGGRHRLMDTRLASEVGCPHVGARNDDMPCQDDAEPTIWTAVCGKTGFVEVCARYYDRDAPCPVEDPASPEGA